MARTTRCHIRMNACICSREVGRVQHDNAEPSLGPIRWSRPRSYGEGKRGKLRPTALAETVDRSDSNTSALGTWMRPHEVRVCNIFHDVRAEKALIELMLKMEFITNRICASRRTPPDVKISRVMRVEGLWLRIVDNRNRRFSLSWGSAAEGVFDNDQSVRVEIEQEAVRNAE